MIIPQYWAEGRVRHRDRNRQITVRRFGWSDTSPEEAQSNADARAREALQRMLAGENLERREPKIPYNGAEGVPIREEIVSRHGKTIITRNSYGARCLNTPDVLFVDMDFEEGPGVALSLAVFAIVPIVAVVTGRVTHSTPVGVACFVVMAFLIRPILLGLHRMQLAASGGSEGIARKRLTSFIAKHPDWHLRLYRTPAGFRVLAMHRTFNPEEPEVAECFRALGADPVYVRMCLNQQCFRARVSPKPWRIGIGNHIRPERAVWPIDPEKIPAREKWIANYESAARAYASCRFVESMGSKAEHPDARSVQELHDRFCQAATGLPIA